MNYTTGNQKTFLDSNIFLYLFGEDKIKREKANKLLKPEFLISTQVVAENVNVCLKKLKLSKDKAFSHGNFLLEKYIVVQITSTTFQKAFEISNKYQFSFWDSLIIASALQNDCRILFSEDMQDGLVIETTLTIQNPFKILV